MARNGLKGGAKAGGTAKAKAGKGRTARDLLNDKQFAAFQTLNSELKPQGLHVCLRTWRDKKVKH